MSTAGLNTAHWMAGIRRIAASVICALTIMTAPNAVRSAEVADRGAPFIPGERFTFVLNWSRSVDLAVGTHIQRPVTDGKKQIMGHARVIRQERVTVPAGTFDTFLIEPDLRHVGGVFDKRPGAKIQLWVSADPRRLPVKLKSKVVVGSFSGELVSIVNAASLAAPEHPKE